MILKYKNYIDGVHQISEKFEAKDLNLPAIFSGDIELDCRMDKSMHQIILDCSSSGIANFECDRCNAEFTQQIKSDFKITFFFEENDSEDDELDIKFISPDQDKINISDEIKEYLLLNIPMKILCSEDCKGLCVSCGTNLNETTCNCHEEKINSVWEPLKKLKNNSNH